MFNKLGKGAGIAIVAGAVIFGTMAGSTIRSWFSSLSGTGGTPSSYVSTEDETLTTKLQGFINCINNVDSPLRASAGEYRQAYDKLISGQIESLSAINRIRFKIKPHEVDNQFSRDCLKELKAAIAMPPVNATLDGQGKIYADTLDKLIPLMNTADSYYDQSDYKDDRFAKAKELDGQFTPLFDQLFTASTEIRASVERLNGELHERELIAMEKADGKTSKWHLLNVMFQSRRAVDAVDAAASANALTVETIQAIERKLQAAYDDGKAYAAAHPDEKTRLGNKPLWFYSERYVGYIISDLKTLRRDIADNKPQAEISRDYEQVGKNFNDLVQDYNMRSRYAD